MKIKKDLDYGKQYFLSGLKFFGCSIICIPFCYITYSSMPILAVFLGTVGVYFFVIGIVDERSRMKNYKCPQCQEKLEYPDVISEEPIMFECHKCQIKWDVGLRVPFD